VALKFLPKRWCGTRWPSNVSGASDQAVWVASVLGSAPRRLGDLHGSRASWSPKGDQIAYCIGPELRVARADGSDSRMLYKAQVKAGNPHWSPDRRTIRFTLAATNRSSLWDISSAGGGVHRVFPICRGTGAARGPRMGRIFVFAGGERTWDSGPFARRNAFWDWAAALQSD